MPPMEDKPVDHLTKHPVTIAGAREICAHGFFLDLLRFMQEALDPASIYVSSGVFPGPIRPGN